MNPFKPSTKRKPIIFGADPRDYFKTAKGPESERGNPEFVMSRSELEEFAICPHRWLRSSERKITDAMRWGSLLDCIVLSPAQFESIYSIAPETYLAEPKKKGDPAEKKPWNYNATFCKEWRAQEIASGKEVTTSEDASLAWLAAKRLREDEMINAFLNVCQPQVQVNVEYTDQDTGITIQIKCMIDLLPKIGTEFGSCIGDFKTTDSAGLRDWQRTVASQRHHYQAAMYLDAVNAATALEYNRFVHVVQEKDEPFETARRELSQEFLMLGRIAYRRDLASYCRCLERKRWPGYDDADSLDELPEIIGGWRMTPPPAWMLAEL